VEFNALRALSPYHNLKPEVCYPPTLVLAGEKDDIAVPSHAYKFVAALQASQPCSNPALLQVAWGAGHTFGTSNETSAENWARQLAFVARALGIDPASPQLHAVGRAGFRAETGVRPGSFFHQPSSVRLVPECLRQEHAPVACAQEESCRKGS
jgi:hypothetical protein